MEGAQQPLAPLTPFAALEWLERVIAGMLARLWMVGRRASRNAGGRTFDFIPGWSARGETFPFTPFVIPAKAGIQRP